MPRNGSGVYGPPAGTAAVPNTTIESADFNAVVADIAQALTDSVNVQGTAPYQSNQPMGGNKLTGLGVGSAAGDSANIGQIQADIIAHAASVAGTADAIAATFSPAFTAYAPKMRFRFTAGAANTIAAPTVNVDGLGPKTVKKLNGVALAVGDIAGVGHVCDCVYNGTDVILLNYAPLAVDREQIFTAKQTFTRPLITTISALTDAATIAWDMADRPNDVKILLSASRNLGAATNLVENQKGRLVIMEDGTGGWSLTPNAAYKQPGGQTVLDLDKAANARTVYEYHVVKNSGGASEVWLKRLWSEGRNTIGFYRDFDLGVFFTSNQQTFVRNHELGRHPALVACYFQCLVADNGYSVDDRAWIFGGAYDTGDGDASHYGLTAGSSATQAWVALGLNVRMSNKATGLSDTPLSSRWRVFMRIYE